MRLFRFPYRSAKPAWNVLPALLLALPLAMGLAPGSPQAADSTRCIDKVSSHLKSLPLAPGDAKSIRIIEQTNLADETGPEIFGVDAWVRLSSCSGWLVIDMTPTCYVKQSYTRGDCRIEGLPNF